LQECKVGNKGEGDRRGESKMHSKKVKESIQQKGIRKQH